MLPGPVFLIEVQTAGRRARFVLVRALYASLLLAALCIAYTIYADSWRAAGPPTIEATASLSNTFYHICVWGQLFAIVACAPAIVAGAIAQDRERRILDALFASDLRDAEIVLSKYAARVLHVLMIVLAGLPVLQIASLMGGISPQRLWMSFAIILSTIVFVAAIALLVSVQARRARDAVLGTYVLLFLWFILPLLLLILFGIGMPGIGRLNFVYLQQTFDLLMLPNPFLTLLRVTADPATRLTAIDPWAEVARLVAVQTTIAALSLLASVWLLRRVHCRIAARPEKKRDRWRLLRPAVGARAMVWKEFFAEQSGGLMRVLSWLVLGGAMAVVVGFVGWLFLDSFDDSGGFASYGSRGIVSASYAVISFLISSSIAAMFVACGILLLVAARAASSVTGERERDTWTVLLGTTLGGPEIVLAKIAGNIFAFRYLYAGLALVWLLMLARQPVMVIPLFFQMIVLVETSWFASALGVFFSLRSQTTARAMGATVGTLVLVGGGYFFCCLPCIFSAGPGSDDMMISLAPMIPFLLMAPSIFAIEGPPGHESAVMLAAMFLGTVGYGFAGFVLTSYCLASFDRLAGRSHRGNGREDWGRQDWGRLRGGSLAASEESVIVAELVPAPTRDHFPLPTTASLSPP